MGSPNKKPKRKESSPYAIGIVIISIPLFILVTSDLVPENSFIHFGQLQVESPVSVSNPTQIKAGSKEDYLYLLATDKWDLYEDTKTGNLLFFEPKPSNKLIREIEFSILDESTKKKLLKVGYQEPNTSVEERGDTEK